MEFLNIGIPELILILLLMLILLGPDEMMKTARSLAKGIRKVIQSPQWRDFLQTSQEIQEIPTNLLREAGYDEIKAEYQKANLQARTQLSDVNDAFTIKPLTIPVQPQQPPAADETGDENQPDETQPIPPDFPEPYRPSQGDKPS